MVCVNAFPIYTVFVCMCEKSNQKVFEYFDSALNIDEDTIN